MFRLFQRLVTALATFGICAVIFYLVSLFYAHVGAVVTKVTEAPKPNAGVVYVMTFKNGVPSKPQPSKGQPKPKSSNSRDESPQ